MTTVIILCFVIKCHFEDIVEIFNRDLLLSRVSTVIYFVKIIKECIPKHHRTRIEKIMKLLFSSKMSMKNVSCLLIQLQKRISCIERLRYLKDM